MSSFLNSHRFGTPFATNVPIRVLLLGGGGGGGAAEGTGGDGCLYPVQISSLNLTAGQTLTGTVGAKGLGKSDPFIANQNGTAGTATTMTGGYSAPGGDGGPHTNSGNYGGDGAGGPSASPSGGISLPGPGIVSNITGVNIEYGKGGRGVSGVPRNGGSGFNFGDGGESGGTDYYDETAEATLYSNGGDGADGAAFIRFATDSMAWSATGTYFVSAVGGDTLIRWAPGAWSFSRTG